MKLIKTLLALLAALVIVVLFAVVANAPGTKAAPPQPQVLHHGPKPYGTYDPLYGPNYTKRVVLSFDDCPRSRQAFVRVVRAARKHNIGLVLAPTGQCLLNQHFVVGVARNNGQYVINHTVSHPDLRRLTSQGIRREFGRPGVLASYGRPPYGALNQHVRRSYTSQHLRIWLWTVDTNDWHGLSAQSIVRYVVRTAKARDTVLMHMQWRAFNPTIIQTIVERLAHRGLKVCRAYPGRTPARLPASLPC